MKVMCIVKGAWQSDTIDADHTGPKYGEICTVIGTDNDYYLLKEYPCDIAGETQYFRMKHFIPLSEIDELELAEQRLVTA